MTKSKAQKAKAKRARKGPQPVTSPGKKKKRNRKNKNRQSNMTQVQRVNPSSQGANNLGTQIGQGLGSLVGKGLNAAWNWVTGSGAYTVKQNSIASGRPPMFAARMGGDGTLEFAHSEFLQDISGSTAFTLQNFFINPGLFGTFPYLSNLANHFEQYEMLGLVFQFRSTSAVALNSTNTALGVVIMSTEYDVLDINFQSKQQMEAYMFTTSSSPAVTMTHPVECAPRMNVLSDQYVRSTAYPTGADPRFYDLGNFQIATQGMQAAATIGELWVSYHVRLKKPKLPTPLGEHLLGFHAFELPSNGMNTANPFGSSTGGNDRLAFGSTLPTVMGTNSFTLPLVGNFLSVVDISAGQAILQTVQISVGANITFKEVWHLQNGTACFNGVDGKSITCHILEVLQPGTGAANTVTVVMPVGVTSGTIDVVVQQVSTGLEVADRSSDTKRANFLDDLSERLARLEMSSGVIRSGSLTDDDWKCDESVKLKRPRVLPNMDKTLKDKASKPETSLSDSV